MSQLEINVLCNSITLLSMICLLFKNIRRYSGILLAISIGLSIGYELFIKSTTNWMTIGVSIVLLIIFEIFILNKFFDKEYNLKFKK